MVARFALLAQIQKFFQPYDMRVRSATRPAHAHTSARHGKLSFYRLHVHAYLNLFLSRRFGRLRGDLTPPPLLALLGMLGMKYFAVRKTKSCRAG